MSGTLVSIHIAPGPAAEMVSVPEIRAVAGMGLEGDRYYLKIGSFAKKWGPDRHVTLIEMEAIEAVARDYHITLDPGAARRNLVTRGVPLNHLIGREISIGDVMLRGLRLCEPCGHLEKLTGLKVEEVLKHRGGLRAEILTSGTLRAGDTIVV